MKQAILIYNTKSGKGNKTGMCVESLAEVFRERDFELQLRPIDFGRNPFGGLDAMPDLVVVAGGDGTLNYVVNAMKALGLDLPIGVIPAGTANDFARAVGMASDPLTAARQILDGEIDRLDCGRVNDLYFVNIFSFGIFTTTSQHTSSRQKRRIGKLAYLIEGIKEFRAMHAVPLTVTADGRQFDFNSWMVLVFNGKTAGGLQLTRRSSLKDGKFDCLLVKKNNLLVSTWAAANYLMGGHSKNVKYLQVHEIEITSPINEPTDIDGQRGAEFPLHITCLPGALQIVVPRVQEE